MGRPKLTAMDDPSPTPVKPRSESGALAVHRLLEDGQADAAIARFNEAAPSIDSNGGDALVAMEIAALMGDRPRARAALLAFGTQGHPDAMVHEAGAALEWAFGHRDAAAAHDDWLAKHIGTRGKWRYLLRSARRWSKAGDHDKAAPRAERFLAWPDGSLRTRLQAIHILWDAGQYAIVAERLKALAADHPDAVEPVALLGRLDLWRGDYAAAAARGQDVSARAPKGVEGWRLQGAAAVGSGADADAIPHLDKALAESPRDIESLIWRAEAHTRLGNWDAADGDIAANIRVDGHIGVAFVRMWNRLVRETQNPGRRRWFSRYRMSPKRGLYARLYALAPSEAWVEASQSAVQTLALLESIRGAFRGNRSDRPTVCSAPEGTLGDTREAIPVNALMTAPLQSSPRDRSANILRTLPQSGPAAVRTQLNALASEHPESPHPFCYQGELELWMGDLDGAMAAFRGGLNRMIARWAYIGMAAIHYLRGQPWRARWTIYWLRDHFEPLPASTLPVYRGEGMRRAGKHDAAVRDLRQAIGFKPTRLGARINLVLSLRALGRGDDAASELREVTKQAPSLLWAAERGLGSARIARDDLDAMTPVLERALVMMRANRSSTRLTYFVNEGDAEDAVQMPIAARISVELAKDLTSIIAALEGRPDPS